MNSIISNLIFALVVLASLALAIKILSRRVAVILILVALFRWVIHPRLRDELPAMFTPLISVILSLVLMLLGLRMIVRGKLR